MKLKIILFFVPFIIANSLVAQIDASYAKGLKFTAPDESFSLKFGIRIQPLFTTNVRDFEKFDDPALTEVQMMIRRARLKFDGFVYDKKLTYKFELAFGNRNIGGISEYTNMGARIILDAVVKYQATKNFSVWFGQTKLPGNRERVISSQKLQFVDRNVVNSRFNLDRDMGFQVHGKHKTGNVYYKTAFALSMGEGRNITIPNHGGFEYTLRGEILPLGAFTGKGDYSESSHEREPKPKLSIGATVDYNDGAVRARSNQGGWMVPDGAFYTNSLTTLWVDFIFKTKGWSVQGEWASRTSEKGAQVFDSNGDLFDTYYVGSGVNMQLGYLFKSNWEFAGRTTFLRPEELVTNQVNQYTFVISKYISGHRLKVQSDITYSDFKSLNGSTHVDPLMFRFQVEIGF